jgi:hypothetical protein
MTEQTVTAEALAVAYRKVADQLEGAGASIASDEDVDFAVYAFTTREELVALVESGKDVEVNQAYLLIWDCADGKFGPVGHEAARLFNATV